ncbi:prefoldin subunit 3-like [Aedes albopictus]|uniref:Prefoldin subunit 3 n=1 Tax=Aedes albopictus TaxID=7160 RepID=A0A023EHL6_AEDAL|nr:prefoldin subunit 3 [Aedes albopictus]XP_029734009.1 prefoldin subunit 3-like [Aedes albopictus]XP_029734071.1 prefoldin subunit 3-like [Aedes albopictus]
MLDMENIELPKLENDQKSYAGIPEAVFVEDVEAFMKQSGSEENVEKVLKSLDEQHSKYKFMEFNIISRKRRLRQQIPDLAKSLEMIKILKNQSEEQETRFLLSEQVFVKTRVPPTKTVCLWLGANVMLEYPLDEAEELLKQNKHSAEVNLKCLEHDQDFLRDQITTTEVNMARVHNYDVKKRQAKKAAEEK